jgi:hypothetical protein
VSAFLIVATYLVLVHSASLSLARYSIPLRAWIIVIAAELVLRRFSRPSAQEKSLHGDVRPT